MVINKESETLEFGLKDSGRQHSDPSNVRYCCENPLLPTQKQISI